MITANDIRAKFISFFEDRGHNQVHSSSLVPIDDPTLLFTNAGMNQFKNIFLGLETRNYKRAVTSQKCVRAGGKHNDLDTVGKTARHHTFFEMLGNFSFGDYFKKEAIAFAWEFLTKELKLSTDNLYITVYQDDDEAYEYWEQTTGFSSNKILRLGEKDNFWSMGETGPCGPCSEIHFDRGIKHSCSAPDCGLGKCDCDRWLEIWNLVFMQYNRDDKGVLTTLPKPSIDTGLGLERIVSIMQQVNSNYETDLLKPLINEVEKLSNKKYDQGLSGFPFRVIADHARSCTFLISDGVLPSNDGRGYVLRRIIRRAVRFGKSLGINNSFLYKMSPKVMELMKDSYPELADKLEFVQKIIKNEEERFQETLNDGLKIVTEVIKSLKEKGQTQISGKEAFNLYDTYGFPLDLTKDIAEEENLTVDTLGFENAMKEQRDRARNAQKDNQTWDIALTFAKYAGNEKETLFTGYDSLSEKGQILKLISNGSERLEVTEGDEVYVLLDVTPFYPEGGGQAGDSGIIVGEIGKIIISNTTKLPDNKIIHKGKVSGKLMAGETVTASVDENTRKAIARNHTATHLLHKALKEVLGDHVNQAGSLLNANSLRFDFSHFSQVTGTELEKIEDLINHEILQASLINVYETDIETAKKDNVTALFNEKYGEKVRCVSIGEISLELCGGTHLKNTSEIGLFKIISEGSVASGIRRIEGVTGQKALELIKGHENQLKSIGTSLKINPKDINNKLEQMASQLKENEKEIEELRAKLAKYQVTDLLDNIITIKEIKLLTATINGSDMNSLRSMADTFRDKVGSGVIVLGSEYNGKLNFVAVVTKDLITKGIHAGNIIKEVAKRAGGGGGGRPEMAQAGGTDVTKLQEALDLVPNIIESQLKN
ncbi:alanyl-tRNA synthetase [Desulfonispora thiosulfatigenes DSM 11270]|uniref:Alanine--tRNA ligase n=1 Tax=Desulfonispora thiosulfatigenes DSM 11270 TaxID=656914 RepID=A0A1W1VQR5_DESTI|nr:alanine--tRNA ligase [Desulfonispora thiosulfatigenes]SMB95613.1 alanyl-tRNA synthetase [Desulfonispora thiosulfatigenes DSM 11270]